jgi:hypothetical protein
MAGELFSKRGHLDFRFRDLLDSLLTSTDAFIHAGSERMQACRINEGRMIGTTIIKQEGIWPITSVGSLHRDCGKQVI